VQLFFSTRFLDDVFDNDFCTQYLGCCRLVSGDDAGESHELVVYDKHCSQVFEVNIATYCRRISNKINVILY